jgi:hypothetical protein
VHKVSVLLPIDGQLRLVLYGLAIFLEAVINAKEVERLFAHSESGDRNAQDYVFYDGPRAKIYAHVDEYEPETVFLHVESKQLEQQTLERFLDTAKNQAFHST